MTTKSRHPAPGRRHHRPKPTRASWDDDSRIAGRGLTMAMIAVVLGLLLVLGGCRDADSVPPGTEPEAAAAASPETGSDHAAHEHRGSAPAAVDATGHSIYSLPGSWRNQEGRELSLRDLAGRVQVVAMVYTHCSYACPRILARMKRIEGEVVDEADGEVGFTLVSIDPERDRPARLKAFAEKSRLDSDRWTLLNGSDRDIRGLSVLLGVQYRATGDEEFAHSNVISVLDRNGVVVQRVEGLSADLGPAVEAVRRLLRP